MRDLWALYASGGLDDGIALELLGHPVAGVRRWTIRLLGDDHRMNSAICEPGSSVWPRPSPTPRCAASSRRAASAWASSDALPILSRLARHDEDATDTHIPNLIWWAFERQLRNDRPAVVALLCTPDAQKPPLFRIVLERTARVLASDGTDARLRSAGTASWRPRRATRRPGRSSRESIWDWKAGGSSTPPLPWSVRLSSSGRHRRGAPGTALIRVCARMGRPDGDRGRRRNWLATGTSPRTSASP